MARQHTEDELNRITEQGVAYLREHIDPGFVWDAEAKAAADRAWAEIAAAPGWPGPRSGGAGGDQP